MTLRRKIRWLTWIGLIGCLMAAIPALYLLRQGMIAEREQVAAALVDSAGLLLRDLERSASSGAISGDEARDRARTALQALSAKPFHVRIFTDGIVPPGWPAIDRAVTAILAQPGAPHSIASLAQEVRMSRATFIRHFSRLTGMSPMQYVTRARLDHAAQLLRTTALPVKVIAAQIGFQNRSHFSRAFREAHGADPSNFRRAEAVEA